MLQKVWHRILFTQSTLLTDKLCGDLGDQGFRKSRNSINGCLCSCRCSGTGGICENHQVRWEQKATTVDGSSTRYNFPFNHVFWPVIHNLIDNFQTLCHIVADISAAPATLQRGTLGQICYTREYDVVLLVGLTELKAQIRWTDSATVRICHLFRLQPLF